MIKADLWMSAVASVLEDPDGVIRNHQTSGEAPHGDQTDMIGVPGVMGHIDGQVHHSAGHTNRHDPADNRRDEAQVRHTNPPFGAF